ncbi:hypothetical protein [Sphingomonas sp. DT-204]|uniref:hypothetical protein n=1 Tax=Sphingomonas sp. DT-204 TaxID=3396166 RepID=UPI003F1D23D9
MRKDRVALKRVSTPGCVVLALAVAAAGIWWLIQSSAESGEKPAAEGIVIAESPAADSSPPPAATMPARAANLPALPHQLIAHVRRTYPLLTDVDFSCDSAGCAVTATIPPPTGDEFLQKRQEMLLGGLAKVVEADGYRVVGPVQMDEIDDNLFHIRAPLVQADERAM